MVALRRYVLTCTSSQEETFEITTAFRGSLVELLWKPEAQAPTKTLKMGQSWVEHRGLTPGSDTHVIIESLGQLWWVHLPGQPVTLGSQIHSTLLYHDPEGVPEGTQAWAGWLWVGGNGTLSSMMVATSGRPLTTLARSGMERKDLSAEVLPAALLPSSSPQSGGLVSGSLLVSASTSCPVLLVCTGSRR